MGGKPVESKSLAEYAKALNADRLKTQNDVLDLAARLAADEVMHWTILNSALGRPLPAGGMPFGA